MKVKDVGTLTCTCVIIIHWRLGNQNDPLLGKTFL